MPPHRNYIYVTRNTVTVRFETRRKPVCGKLEIYHKSGRLNATEKIRGKASGILAVGNWNFKLFQYDNNDVCQLESLHHVVGYKLRDPNAVNRNIFLELDGLTSEEIRSVQRTVKDLLKECKIRNRVEVTNSSRRAARQLRFVEEIPRQSAFFADMTCNGATALAEGMVSRAKAKSEDIDQVRKMIQDSQEHRILPSDPNYIEVDPIVRTAAGVAMGVTSVLAVGTSLGVRGLYTVAGLLGSTVGPAVKSGASKLIACSDSPRDIQTVRNKVEDFCNVAGGILSCIGTVLGGIEQSASILAPSVFQFIGTVVGKNHGSEAGKLTEDVLHTAGNLVATGYNIQCVRSAKVFTVKTASQITKDCLP